jgi:hypothetical protein
MAAYEIRELRVTQLLLNLKNYRFDPMWTFGTLLTNCTNC